jgi:ATP phosphoribosyltransferase-like protein
LKQEQNKYRTGALPERYPLATALTPWQESTDPAYGSADALARGTLFPGLDLPFMDLVNPELPACPATELMAIDFVCDELALYLDTHQDDKEAFALLPAMRSPTVMPLAIPGWSSVHSVVDDASLWETVERLKGIGAEGILVLNMDKIID